MVSSPSPTLSSSTSARHGPTHRVPRRPARVAVAFAVALALPTAASGATPSLRPGAIHAQVAQATPTPQPVPAEAASTTTVELPTGDVVTLTDTLRGPIVSPVGPMTGGGATVYSIGRSTYAFPRSVQALVGTVLAPSLFDVRALAAHPDAPVPVRVTYAAPSSPTPVAGVEITSRTGRTGRGYLTAASRAAFRKALEKTSAATLLTNVTAISGGGGHPVTPSWPMNTLTVKTVGAGGRPVAAQVAVINLDDPLKPSLFVTTNGNGVTKVSVPTGTYEVLAAATNRARTVTALASTRQFTVDAAGAVTLDIRTATTPLVTTLDRPVSYHTVVTELTREITGKDGESVINRIEVVETGSTPTRIYLTPTTGHLLGSQRLQRFVSASSPVGAPDAYTYTTYYAHDGAIPRTALEYHSDATNLTAYDSAFYAPTGHSGAVVHQSIAGAEETRTFDTVLPGPTRLTRYVTAGSGVTSGAAYVQEGDATGDHRGEFVQPAGPTQPGRVRFDGWGKPPLHSHFVVTPQSPGDPVWCPACLNGYAIGVALSAMDDSNPAHSGSADVVDGSEVGTYALSGDRMSLASGPGPANAQGYYLPGTKTFSVTQTSTRDLSSAAPIRVTTTLTTKAAAAVPLPDTWICGIGGDCSVLPFLSVDYDAPVNLAGRLAPGDRTLGLTVHQVGRAQPVGVRTVRAWIRYGSGVWRSLPTHGSGASWTASLSVPQVASPTSASLRVAVTDRAGSTLSETMTNVFTLPTG